MPDQSMLYIKMMAVFSVFCSCVLVLPYAFSQTGVLLGILTCLVVAYCNILTCKLLLRTADKTGHDSYEGIAEALGGRVWKVGGPRDKQVCCYPERLLDAWPQNQLPQPALHQRIQIV
jgi:hypothetical protein